MKNTILLFALTTLALSSGCQNSPQRVFVRPFPAEPPGTFLDEQQAAAIRQPPVLKGYQLGPYVDPNNPRVLHREHEMVVEESSGGWKRMPQTLVQRGPTVVAPDSAQSPQFVAGELQMRLREVNQVLQSSQEQTANTTQVISQLQTVTNLLSAVLQRQATLEQRTRSLEQQKPPAPARQTNAPAAAPKKATGRDAW